MADISDDAEYKDSQSPLFTLELLNPTTIEDAFTHLNHEEHLLFLANKSFPTNTDESEIIMSSLIIPTLIQKFIQFTTDQQKLIFNFWENFIKESYLLLYMTLLIQNNFYLTNKTHI